MIAPVPAPNPAPISPPCSRFVTGLEQPTVASAIKKQSASVQIDFLFISSILVSTASAAKLLKFQVKVSNCYANETAAFMS
jgi:hypothetical protein